MTLILPDLEDITTDLNASILFAEMLLEREEAHEEEILAHNKELTKQKQDQIRSREETRQARLKTPDFLDSSLFLQLNGYNPTLATF